MSREKLLIEISEALAEFQPALHIIDQSNPIKIEGQFSIRHDEREIDSYVIRLNVTSNFPSIEPTVFEIGGRIPKTNDRHINPNGSCCITIMEYWLATNKDQSFRAFLNGPMRDFFLGQFLFEKEEKWPFGEWS